MTRIRWLCLCCKSPRCRLSTSNWDFSILCTNHVLLQSLSPSLAFVNLVYLPYFSCSSPAAVNVNVYDKVSKQSATTQTLHGMWIACIAFLAYGCTQLRDSVMVRPHPVVWRLACAGLIYFFIAVCTYSNRSRNSKETHPQYTSNTWCNSKYPNLWRRLPFAGWCLAIKCGL